MRRLTNLENEKVKILRQVIAIEDFKIAAQGRCICKHARPRICRDDLCRQNGVEAARLLYREVGRVWLIANVPPGLGDKKDVRRTLRLKSRAGSEEGALRRVESAGIGEGNANGSGLHSHAVWDGVGAFAAASWDAAGAGASGDSADGAGALERDFAAGLAALEPLAGVPSFAVSAARLLV